MLSSNYKSSNRNVTGAIGLVISNFFAKLGINTKKVSTSNNILT